jgi:hypothetical protein
MIAGFESYSLGAWSDVNGLMLSGKVLTTSAHSKKEKERRTGKWSFIVSGAVGAACVAISTVLLPASSSSAVTVSMLPRDIQDIDIPSSKQFKAVAVSPIREINRSFNRLFDSVRAGKGLIPSEGVRLLARRALKSQKERVDIDSWAQSLANDVKDADD